jgi:hypothetical protein
MTVQLESLGAICCGVRVEAVTLDDAVDRLRAFAEEVLPTPREAVGSAM